MTELVLDIKELRKAYGQVVALDGVSLGVRAGQIVGLLGPNGAGKTTLVSIVCGLRRADAGDVRVRGIDALAHPEKVRRHIGLAPQETGVYPIDSVRQNLALFGELAGLRGRDLTGQIEEVATALRLHELLDRKTGELSGGQKRRLHTAIALLNRPPLILLDEATTGADVETRAALIEVVKDLARRGSAILYSTHYLNEVETLGAEVVIVDQGRVIAEGSVADLVSGNGGAVVELTFDGPPPTVPGDFHVTYDDQMMRISTDDAGRAIGRIMAILGADAGRLQGVEIINPSLETVFLALTGRRYESGEEADVVAS